MLEHSDQRRNTEPRRYRGTQAARIVAHLAERAPYAVPAHELAARFGWRFGSGIHYARRHGWEIESAEEEHGRWTYALVPDPERNIITAAGDRYVLYATHRGWIMGGCETETVEEAQRIASLTLDERRKEVASWQDEDISQTVTTAVDAIAEDGGEIAAIVPGPLENATDHAARLARHGVLDRGQDA